MHPLRPQRRDLKQPNTLVQPSTAFDNPLPASLIFRIPHNESPFIGTMQNFYILTLAATVSQIAAQQFVMYTPGGDDTSIQRIDPILAPSGISSHVHQVFGPNGLRLEMTYESLQESSCTTVGSAGFEGNKQDQSVYWHSALYMELRDGSGFIRVPTNGHKLYYLDVGQGDKRQPFQYPRGFRMLAGDPFLRAPASNTEITLWKCSTNGAHNFGKSGGFLAGVITCSDYPYFYNSVEFPHCWNGGNFAYQILLHILPIRKGIFAVDLVQPRIQFGSRICLWRTFLILISYHTK